MAIDHTGTEPGLAQGNTTQRMVDMRCRNAACDAMQVLFVDTGHLPPGKRLYQCQKCQNSWTLDVGGGFNY